MWQTILWFILATQLGFCCCQLEIDPSVGDTLATRMIESFKGQYPCFPENLNGTFRVIVFDVFLNNASPNQTINMMEGITLYYEIIDSSDVVQIDGNLHIDCLRDTRCQGDLNYYVCSDYRLSPGCTYERSRDTLCQWIDVSHLPFSNYRFVLALHGLGPGPVPTTNSTVLVKEFSLGELPKLKSPTISIFLVLLLTFTAINVAITFEPFVGRKKKPKVSKQDMRKVQLNKMQ